MSPKLYSEFAHLWPMLSPPEDYAPEADALRSLIESEHPEAGKRRLSILELGAGGGHTLHHLQKDFDCTAVDIAAEMLEQCRQLNPDVETIEADMRSCRLKRKFDTVFVHDAIDYMTTQEDAAASVRTAATHLAKDGLCFIAPTYTRENFENHNIEADVNGDPSTGNILAYSSYVHDCDPDDDVFELVMVLMLNVAGEVQVIEDRHKCGLFERDQWAAWMEQVGLEVFVPDVELPFTLLLGKHDAS